MHIQARGMPERLLLVCLLIRHCHWLVNTVQNEKYFWLGNRPLIEFLPSKNGLLLYNLHFQGKQGMFPINVLQKEYYHFAIGAWHSQKLLFAWHPDILDSCRSPVLMPGMHFRNHDYADKV